MTRKFLLLFFLFPILLYAQKNDDLEVKLRFLNFSGGVEHIVFRDEGMSPLRYSGIIYSAGMGFEKHGPKAINQLELRYSTGNITSNAGTRVQPVYASLSYSHLRHLFRERELPVTVFAGPSTKTMGDMNVHPTFGNNSINYILNTNLGATARVNYPFTFVNRQFHASYEATIPIINFIIRPSYNSSVPEGFLGSESFHREGAFRSIQVHTINNFPAFQNSFRLEYPLSNQNRLQLRYMWDFYSFRPVNRLHTSKQLLDFSLKFNF